jgi:hypothetical protein
MVKPKIKYQKSKTHIKKQKTKNQQQIFLPLEGEDRGGGACKNQTQFLVLVISGFLSKITIGKSKTDLIMGEEGRVFARWFYQIRDLRYWWSTTITRALNLSKPVCQVKNT